MAFSFRCSVFEPPLYSNCVLNIRPFNLFVFWMVKTAQPLLYLVPAIPKRNHFYPNIIMFGFKWIQILNVRYLSTQGIFSIPKALGAPCFYQSLAMSTKLSVYLQSKQPMRSLQQVLICLVFLEGTLYNKASLQWGLKYPTHWYTTK